MQILTCPGCGRNWKITQQAKHHRCPNCKAVINGEQPIKRPPQPPRQPVQVPMARPVESSLSPPPSPTPPAQSQEPVTKASNPDEILYADESYQSIAVTRSRIIIGNSMYPVRNVTSVRTSKTKDTNGGMVLIIVGIMFSLVGLSILMSDDPSGASAGIAAIVAGMSTGGFGIYSLASVTPDYHIFLASASGEKKAWGTKNADKANRLMRAINDAIATYKD